MRPKNLSATGGSIPKWVLTAYELTALLLGSVVPAVEQYKRKRALRSKDKLTYFTVIIPLVANLIHHYLIGSPGKGIVVPRSRKALGGKGNRYQPFVFPHSFPKMLDALSALGFAKVSVGKYSGIPGQSKRTTVRAGAKLIELIKQHNVTLDDLSVGHAQEIIRNGPSVDTGTRERGSITKTLPRRRYRDELRRVNSWLANADISFDATNYDQPVDVDARQMRRHFTLGRFDRGGRLFGGFWETLPKDVRLLGIRIEGETVIGLDYSQVNPLLAYYVARLSRRQTMPTRCQAWRKIGMA